MANVKKTLYEILEVQPNASLSEIQAAHKRLSLHLVSGKSGLSREDAELNLKVIDMALHTLSVQSSRDAYDAQLAPLQEPARAVVPRNDNAVLRGSDVVPLRIAAAIEDTHRMAAAIESDHKMPLAVISKTVDGTVSALKKILAVIGFLLALGMVIKVASMNSQTENSSAETSKAEEKVILQEYYQEHGVRPGSKVEADLLDVENRRKENERREAAYEKERQDSEYRQFVEESRRRGEQVSENLRRDEERARYEEEQKKRQAEQERLRLEEAENNRIEEDRRRTEEARRKLGLE